MQAEGLGREGGRKRKDKMCNMQQVLGKNI